jgi:hypothetical protein
MPNIKQSNYSLGFFQTQNDNMAFELTEATDETMLGPPDAPITSETLPSRSVIVVGDIDDAGRAPGRIKLYLEGGTP